MKSDSLEFRVIETFGHLSLKFLRTSALGTLEAGDMSSRTGGGAATDVPMNAMNSMKITGMNFFTAGSSCHRIVVAIIVTQNRTRGLPQSNKCCRESNGRRMRNPRHGKASPAPIDLNPDAGEKLRRAEEQERTGRSGGAPISTIWASGGLCGARGGGRGRRDGGFLARADHGFGEALHFFQLRAELKQEQIGSGAFELANAVSNLLGGADEPGAQPAVRDGIILEGNALLELRVREPLLVIIVAGGVLVDVCDAAKVGLRLGFGGADDRVSGDAELHGREIFLRAAIGKIANLFGDARGRIAMHDVGVALFGD